MAGVEELPPDRNGAVRYRGAYRMADGRVRRKTWDHKRAALRWANAQEQQVVDGSRRDPAKGRMRWSAWCEVWWPTRALEPGTLRGQNSLRVQHVEPRWGDVPLADITHLDVQQWVTQLGRRRSASTTRQAYSQLSASLKAAVRAGIIDHSPCYAVRLPTLPPAPERYLTEAELDRLFYRFDGVYRLLVEVLADTGMRIGEAVALHRHRIDLTAGTVEVVEAWDQHARMIKGYPKGKHRRSVPLTPRLRDLVTEWTEANPASGLCGVRHARGSTCRSPLLMTGPKGAVIDPGNFTKGRWRDALARAGIGSARVHDLRHTYASRLITAGVSMARVQQLVGHTLITTTARYSHLITSGHDEVRAALARPAEGATEGADQGANPPTHLDTARQRRAARNRPRPAETPHADGG